MFSGTLTNTLTAGTPLARLTLGITNAHGVRAEMKFVCAPQDCNTLIAVDPFRAPTEQEMDIQYLTVNEWERQVLEGIGTVWSDPIGGGDHLLENALDIQNARDERDTNATDDRAPEPPKLLHKSIDEIRGSAYQAYYWYAGANWAVTIPIERTDRFEHLCRLFGITIH